MLLLTNSYIWSENTPFECITQDLSDGKTYKVFCGSDGIMGVQEVTGSPLKKWVVTDSTTNGVYQIVTSNGQASLGVYTGEEVTKDDLQPIINMLTELKTCACGDTNNVGFTMTYIGD